MFIDKDYIGIIVQEMQEFVLYVVCFLNLEFDQEESKGYFVFDDMFFIYIIINVIQEQQVVIEV